PASASGENHANLIGRIAPVPTNVKCGGGYPRLGGLDNFKLGVTGSMDGRYLGNLFLIAPRQQKVATSTGYLILLTTVDGLALQNILTANAHVDRIDRQL